MFRLKRRRGMAGGRENRILESPLWLFVRNGWFPGGERPERQVKACACHQRATDWRVVQGEVRQAVLIHSKYKHTTP